MVDLYSFELNRRAEGYLPPSGSNSFFDLTNEGKGKINLLCYRNTPGNERFNIYIESGIVPTGREFGVYGNIYDNTKPYNEMVIKTGSQLIINGTFTISKGLVECHDNLIIESGCDLILEDNGQLVLYPDSSWILEKGSNFDIEHGHITVYGNVTVDISIARELLNHPNITWDPAAVVDVTGFNPAERPVTMRDYEKYIRDYRLAVYSSDRIQTAIGIMEARWRDGSYEEHYQSIQLRTYAGESILGDSKLSVLGLPETAIPHTQLVESLYVAKDTMMFVSDERYNNEYVFPELYMGIKIGNTKSPGYCEVDGNLVISGADAKLTLDRGGYLRINEGGIVSIQNNAKFSCNNADDAVLFIDGTLIVDRIEMMHGFASYNIQFGKYGKIIILNKYEDDHHILYTVPDGFMDTPVYQLFWNRLQYVEYHIQPNTGIDIGVYYDYYSRDLKEWFGRYRIEDAVHRGMVVWHDGGFIQLSSDLIWWVDDQCDLITLSQLFKSVGSLGKERLKEVVNRLQYAGFESIRFVLDITGREEKKEIVMNLTYPKMVSVRPNTGDRDYTLMTDMDGAGFVRKASRSDHNSIINPKSKKFNIIDRKGIIST